MKASPILIVQKGPEKGHSYPLGPQNTIGRDPSNTICFSDRLISRHHCQILKQGNHYQIMDQNSKNGTYVNHLFVKKTTLAPGDSIQIGNTVLTYLPQGKTLSENIALVSTDPKQTVIIHKLPREIVSELQSHLVTKLVHEKTIQDLSALYHVSFSIYTIRNIDRLLNRVLELIFKAIPAERGVILLFDPKSSSLQPRASYLKDSQDKDQIKISSTIVNEAYRENTALLIRDALTDKRFDTKKSILRESIRSAMCIPLSTQKKNFGVIYLDTKILTNVFDEDTLRLVTAISNQVAIAIENIYFHQELEKEASILHRELKQVYNMVGVSPQMKNIFSMIQKIAPTDSTVLITGESGTGKELVARALHYNNPRIKKPFICVNCTAIPETLIESELFGHEKGAFTGAYTTKPGQFELASGGTIFLDEIGEMPPASQIKLLRVLEENKVRHVGGTRDIPVDVRVIAASNKVLDQEISSGSFREDLYYRLKVMDIFIPPLRERKEDIPLLAHYYLEHFKSKMALTVKEFSPEALKSMERYHWPGNVRQLKNSIERAVVMGKGKCIEPADLNLESLQISAATEKPFPTIAEMEKEHIIKALQISDGNKTKAAQLLDIRRSTLYEKIKLYDIK